MAWTKTNGEDGPEYDIHQIDDQSNVFIINVETGSKSFSVTFPARPPKREQMEYAHACARMFLERDLARLMPTKEREFEYPPVLEEGTYEVAF